MAAKEQNDYESLLKQAKVILGKPDHNIKSMQDLAEALGVNYSTMQSGFRRHYKITSFAQLVSEEVKDKQVIDGGQGDTVEVELSGNFGEVRAVNVSGQIRTVDQLLKVAKIDRTVWEAYLPEVRKWDVVLKLKNGETDDVQIVPSFYVATKLKRKKPVAFEPVIAPIQINLPKLPKPGKQVKGGMKRALIINDPQIGFRRRLHTSELVPFHDRRVLDLALQICQEEEIDHISIGGDVDDLSEWSNKFLAEPEFYWTTQPALLETSWWLTQMRLARPHAEIKMLEGNHDLRMPLLIVSNLKQAYKLKAVDELELPPQMTVPRLLALHMLNVEYVAGYPNNGYWLNKNIHIEHGDVVRGAPGATAAAVTNRQAYTTIFGHVHRREMVSKRIKLNEGVDQIYTAFCPGCACHIDGRVPGSSPKDQWQQGLAVVEYTEDFENIIPIAINEGKMIYKERVWQARERDAEIDKVLMDGLEQVTG